MSEMKTRPTGAEVDAFIAGIDHAGRREDASILKALLNEATGTEPVMWGDSLIGYGEYGYHRADGSAHRYFVTGFSPRKANMVVYLMSGCAQHAEILGRLGKHKHSSSCLYLGRLKGIDLEVLAEAIRADIAVMRSRYDDLTL